MVELFKLGFIAKSGPLSLCSWILPIIEYVVCGKQKNMSAVLLLLDLHLGGIVC